MYVVLNDLNLRIFRKILKEWLNKKYIFKIDLEIRLNVFFICIFWIGYKLCGYILCYLMLIKFESYGIVES